MSHRARPNLSIQTLLPAGLETPDHFLFEIAEEEAGPLIGFVWYAISTKHGSRTAYIYDLELEEEHRHKGHAFRALKGRAGPAPILRVEFVTRVQGV